ncbi:MAG: hypothetical protein ABR540_02855 [Acidimicrobiales bacterium]
MRGRRAGRASGAAVALTVGLVAVGLVTVTASIGSVGRAGHPESLAPAPGLEAVDKAGLAQAYARAPLAFEANVGQADRTFAFWPGGAAAGCSSPPPKRC